MIDVANLSDTNSPEYLRELAACLDGKEEITLGPTDIEVCVKALSERAARLAQGRAA